MDFKNVRDGDFWIWKKSHNVTLLATTNINKNTWVGPSRYFICFVIFVIFLVIYLNKDLNSKNWKLSGVSFFCFFSLTILLFKNCNYFKGFCANLAAVR